MRAIIPVLLVWLAAACTGTEIGNPAEGSDLTLTAVSSGTGVALINADAPDADTVVEGAWVVLGDVRFVYDDDCSRGMDSRVTVPGPLVVDLLSGATLPVDLPADVDYCRVRIPLTRAESPSDGAPDELFGHSVLLTGTHVGRPFMIRTGGRPTLELRSMDEPFRLGAEGGAILLAFDVSGWLAGLDLDAAAGDAEDSIVIDEDNERGLLNVFDENLRNALTLYRDVNADGSLDGDEQQVPLAAPEP